MIPVLTVNGQVFDGWKEFSCLKSMESLVCGFELEISQQFLPGADASGSPIRWAIGRGDRCSLALGDTVILDGWIDGRERQLDADMHTLHVSGRDVACDLVDCSATLSRDMWRNLRLEEIAQEIAAPFGLRIVAEADTGAAFPVFKIQPGETGWDAIERLCRGRALLAVSDGAGTITLTRASAEFCDDDLIEGVNIKAVSVSENDEERYSSYTVKTQQISLEGWSQAAHVVATASDQGVRRPRPLLVLAETGGGKAHAQARVEWEASVRAARAETITVTVQGWQQSSGALWPLNRCVNVRVPTYDIDGSMLIKEIAFSLSAFDGTTTTLTLAHPDAFTPAPEVPKSRGIPYREIKSETDLETL